VLCPEPGHSRPYITDTLRPVLVAALLEDSLLFSLIVWGRRHYIRGLHRVILIFLECHHTSHCELNITFIIFIIVDECEGGEQYIFQAELKADAYLSFSILIDMFLSNLWATYSLWFLLFRARVSRLYLFKWLAKVTAAYSWATANTHLKRYKFCSRIITFILRLASRATPQDASLTPPGFASCSNGRGRI